MISSDRQSIFGDTYGGVPNPQIPIEHPWPTRYHGPIFTTPRFGMPFSARPYARSPYSGLGASTPFLAEYRLVGDILICGTVGAVAALAYSSLKKGASNENVGRVAGVASALVPVAAAAALLAAYSSR